jgi:hypothetical protein
MSFFSKLRRGSTTTDPYSSWSASQIYPGSARRRHERHHRRRYDTGETVSHAVSVESIPYLPSETTRGASSEVSLRSEYTHLDNDTSRYPKWSTPTSSAPSPTNQQRVERHNKLTDSTSKLSVISPLIVNVACCSRADGREPDSSHACFWDITRHVGCP